MDDFDKDQLECVKMKIAKISEHSNFMMKKK